jgi:hypothetical protein
VGKTALAEDALNAFAGHGGERFAAEQLTDAARVSRRFNAHRPKEVGGKFRFAGLHVARHERQDEEPRLQRVRS